MRIVTLSGLRPESSSAGRTDGETFQGGLGGYLSGG